MRKTLLTSTLAALLIAGIILIPGCKAEKDKDKKDESNQEEPENEESSEAANEESVDPVPVGPIMRSREKNEAEPQKNLSVLVKKGKRQIQGWRSERKDIYEYFNTLGPTEVNRIKGLVRKTRNFRFDERPERLMEAPAKIYELVDTLFILSDGARTDGEGTLLSHDQMISEVNSGAKRHKQDAIDAKLAHGNSQIKLANYATILARNLIDEAIIYARYGSLEMQDQMRDIFAGLKGRGPADDALQGKLHDLLWLIRTEGIDRPDK